jgi:hypothetical protein
MFNTPSIILFFFTRPKPKPSPLILEARFSPTTTTFLHPPPHIPTATSNLDACHMSATTAKVGHETRATQRCTPHRTQVRHGIPKEQNRCSADTACNRIRVMHPDTQRAMPPQFLQTRRVHIPSKLCSRKLAIDLLGCARSRTSTSINDTAESAPEFYESRPRDTCRQPTDPEHTRWPMGRANL